MNKLKVGDKRYHYTVRVTLEWKTTAPDGTVYWLGRWSKQGSAWIDENELTITPVHKSNDSFY